MSQASGWSSKLQAHTDGTKTCLNDLYQAIQANRLQELALLLKHGVDPNVDLGEITHDGKQFVSCRPLCLAALAGRSEVARALLESRACINNAAYALKVAGGTWEADVAFAALASGNLGLLQELVHARADVHSASRASNGTQVNLLWQAANLGRSEAVIWLLGQHADPSAAASCHGDDSVLHVTARRGDSSAVQALIQASADIHFYNDSGLTALDEAIAYGRPEVVQVLVSSGAELLQDEQTSPRKLIRMAGSFRSSMDLLFNYKHALVTAAAAEGLQQAPWQVLRMGGDNSRHVVQFLQTPGNAPACLFEALFRPSALQYLDDGRRVELKTGYLSGSFRAAEGPGCENLKTMDRRCRELSQEQASLEDFLDALVPQIATSREQLMVPFRAFRCLLPNLQEQPHVVDGIAHGPSDLIFDNLGCQALVEVLYEKARPEITCQVVFAWLCILVLLLVTVELNYGWPFPAQVDFWICSSLLLPLWLHSAGDILAKVLGFFDLGLSQRVWHASMLWMELLRLVVSGALLVCLVELASSSDSESRDAVLELDSHSVPTLRPLHVLLAVVVLLSWIKLFDLLRVRWHAGKRLLPILTALWEGAFPVTALLFFCVASVAHIYYAIGFKASNSLDIIHAIQVSYRLGIVGELDFHELERVGHRLNDDELVTHTPYLHDLRILTLTAGIVVTFIVSIALANTFIAIMCVSYERAERRASQQFFRERSRAGLNSMATLQGWRVLCCLRRKHIGKCDAGVTCDTEKFVWYVVSELTDDSPDGAEFWRNSASMQAAKSQEDIQQLQEQAAQQSQQLNDISAQLREIQSGLSKLGELGVRTGKSKKRGKDTSMSFQAKTKQSKRQDPLDFVFDRSQGPLNLVNFVDARVDDELVPSPGNIRKRRSQFETVTQQQAMNLQLASQTIPPHSLYGMHLRQAGLAGPVAVSNDHSVRFAGVTPAAAAGAAVRHANQENVSSPRVFATPHAASDRELRPAAKLTGNSCAAGAGVSKRPSQPIDPGAGRGGTSISAPSELPRLVQLAGASPVPSPVSPVSVSTALQQMCAPVSSLQASQLPAVPHDEDGWRMCSNGIAALRQRWVGHDVFPGTASTSPSVGPDHVAGTSVAQSATGGSPLQSIFGQQ